MAATAHAKYRAPSAAKRWLSCPFSAYLQSMYPNMPTEASEKGDYWHECMETLLVFGTLPPDVEPDVYEAMMDLRDYVRKWRSDMGPTAKMYVEQRLDIPEIQDFGTVDIALVSDREIRVIDEKSGYVPVDVKMNAQLLTYLLGLIALHGERKKYVIAVHQPNYDHRDGPFREYEVSPEDIEWFRGEVAYSLANDDLCIAGKHCKDTYCPHRGACAPFLAYVERDLALGWHPSEVRALTDAELAIALDAAEQLSGYRNALRAEAMRRIINMDRKLDGFKVVRGRRNRVIKDPVGLTNRMFDQVGFDWAVQLFPDLAPLLSAMDFPVDSESLCIKFIATPKQVEDLIKRYAMVHNLPRGGWKMIYDNIAAPFISETAEGLTLEREIDGRPAHKRGSELGALIPNPAQQANVTII